MLVLEHGEEQVGKIQDQSRKTNQKNLAITEKKRLKFSSNNPAMKSKKNEKDARDLENRHGRTGCGK